MPHLSPMSWMMMIISTWFFMMAICMMIYFPMENNIFYCKAINIKKKNMWYLYSSTNKL